MLKHLLIGIIAVALAFLWAGVAANVFRLPRLNSGGKEGDKEIEYRFFLGCGLVFASGAAAVYSAIGGYFIISAFSLIAVCVGVLLILLCLKKTNGINFGVESTLKNDDSLARDYRQKNSENEEKSATDSGKEHIKSRICCAMMQDPARRAITCGVVFAVFLAVFSLFVADLDSGHNVVEKTVIFQTAQNADDAIFLTDSDGAESYAIFGYALQNDLFSRLDNAVDGERSFTVRYAVMDQDRWSGYYRLLSIKDGDGVSYLEEADVSQSRAGAVTEKAVVFGILALLCGGACGYYTVMAIKERHSETKMKTERENIK